MNVIEFGNTFQIYEDDLKTYKSLPVRTYRVAFNKMMGFSLQGKDDFLNKEEKIYGNHEQKVDKVFNAYKNFDRSLGVILSGDKGIGKSLFTQLLSQKSLEKGLPVIIVDTAYPGIANFIDSIKQEALIMFDEFEKVFSNNDGEEHQDKLLGLFDGTSQVKRLYTITVNELNKVNSYMINRPGRFHYHLRFDYPDAEEVKTYMGDKLSVGTEFIKDVVAFSQKIKLNYDCLRAIVFELNMGATFSEAIKDLNITRSSGERYKYSFTLLDKEGKVYATLENEKRLDLFSGAIKFSEWFSPKGQTDEDLLELSFNPSDINVVSGAMHVSGEDIEVSVTEYSKESGISNNYAITDFVLEKKGTESIHYTI